MLIINDEDHFNEVFEAKKDRVIFAYFTAKWCGPCKAIAPLITELSEKHSDKIEFLKIDLDDNEEVAERYGITGIPAFLIFENGQVVDTTSGADEEKVKEMIAKRV